MRVHQFRRTLKQFATEARQGQVLTEQTERNTIAQLAEQLEARLALNERVIKSDDTISSAPAGSCPCCGR